MSAHDLRVEMERLMAEIRSLGRGAPGGPLRAALDGAFPTLVGAADAYAADVLSDADKERLLQPALAICRRVRERAANPSASGAGIGFTWPWKRAYPPRLAAKRWPWGLGLAGAAALLLVGWLLYQTLRPAENIVTPGPRRESVVPSPEKRGPKPEERIVKEGPKKGEKPVPKPGPKKQETVVAARQPEVGKIGKHPGEALIYPSGSKKGIVAKEGMTVAMGSTIETGDADRIEVRFNDGTVLRSGFNTGYTIPGATPEQMEQVRRGHALPRPDRVVLHSGSLYADVTHLDEGGGFRIEAPTATARVLGTEFVLAVERVRSRPSSVADLRTVLTVREGLVEFANRYGTVRAPAMTESAATAGSAPTEPKRIQTLSVFHRQGPIQFVTVSESLDSVVAAQRAAYPSGWAGLSVIRRDDGSILVVRVSLREPAEAAGIQVGDVVVSVDGRVPRSRWDVNGAMARRRGHAVVLRVRRGTDEFDVRLVPGAQGQLAALPRSPSRQQSDALILMALDGAPDRAIAGLQKLAEATGDPAVYNNLGIAYELQDEVAKAARCYIRAARLAPAEPLYHFNLAIVLRNIGNFERSLEELQEVVRLAPGYGSGWMSLPQAYLLLGDFEGAEKASAEAVRRLPDTTDMWTTRAAVLARLGRGEEALACASKAIALEPTCHFGWLARGGYLMEMRRFQEAEPDLRKATELHPYSPRAFDALGVTLAMLRRPVEALAAARWAVDLDPDVSVFQSNLGVHLRALNKLDEAEKAFRAALKGTPDYLPALRTLAIMLRLQKRYPESEEFYRRAIAADPASESLVAGLGAVFDETNRPDLCEPLYRDFLKLRPDSAMILNNLAWNLFSRDVKLDEALNLAKRAVELTPRDAGNADTLGNIECRLGKLDDAENSLKKAIELYGNPRAAAASEFVLGQVYEKKGEVQKAKDAYRQTLAGDPANKDAQEALKRLGG